MVVVFDTETTGLAFGEDEILQFSAIDENGNVLLDTYIRPTHHTRWDQAESINGISPDMVKNAPTMDEVRPIIQSIFDNADLLVSYNGAFDIAFLQVAGIKIPEVPSYDVMREFAPIYGEYNEYFGDYKWQKLVTAAAYYGYQFEAHNSLEDVKATLFCYKKMIEEPDIQQEPCYEWEP